MHVKNNGTECMKVLFSVVLCVCVCVCVCVREYTNLFLGIISHNDFTLVQTWND